MRLTTTVPDYLALAAIHDDSRRAAAWTAERALEASAAVGVPRIVQIGCELESARWSVEVADRVDALVAAVALHPNEAPRHAVDGSFDAAFDEIA